jgi:hypothetical protein
VRPATAAASALQPPEKKAKRAQQQQQQQQSKSASGNAAALLAAHEEVQRLGASIPGDSPEEVAKWIAARRANWPSRANVQRKVEEAAARAERGEIGRPGARPTLKRAVMDKRTLDRDAGRARRESAAAYASTPKGEAVPAAGALAALAAQYAGDSSDEEEEGNTAQGGGGAARPAKGAAPQASGGDSGGSRRTGKRPRKGKQSGKKGKPGAAGRAVPATSLPPVKPTLLRRLLEPEIRLEQNLLLQCLRILVQEDFFSNAGAGPGEVSDGTLGADCRANAAKTGGGV